MDKEDDDDVGDEVGERMDGVGNHGRTASEDSGYEFKHEQCKIDGAAPQRDAAYLAFALGILNG